MQTLSSLQDRLPSFPTPIAMSVLEEELKRPPGEIFSELSAEPVAAASLGQVSHTLNRGRNALDKGTSTHTARRLQACYSKQPRISTADPSYEDRLLTGGN